MGKESRLRVSIASVQRQNAGKVCTESTEGVEKENPERCPTGFPRRTWSVMREGKSLSARASKATRSSSRNAQYAKDCSIDVLAYQVVVLVRLLLSPAAPML